MAGQIDRYRIELSYSLRIRHFLYYAPRCFSIREFSRWYIFLWLSYLKQVKIIGYRYDSPPRWNATNFSSETDNIFTHDVVRGAFSDSGNWKIFARKKNGKESHSRLLTTNDQDVERGVENLNNNYTSRCRRYCIPEKRFFF